MTSTNEQYATQASDGDGLPLPPAQDQELILDAWREALGQALHIRDTEWKEKVRVMAAESMAAISELRADAAEFRSTMESMIAARLATQLRQPADAKEGPRGEAGPPGKIEGVRPYVEDMVHYEGDIVVREGSTYQARRDTSRSLA